MSSGGLQGQVSQWGVGPAQGLGLVQPKGGDHGGCGSSPGLWHSMAKEWVSQRSVGLAQGWGLAPLRGGYPCGTAQEVGIPLFVGPVHVCGLAQPEGWRAQQNGAVALQACEVGIWQARCSFIKSWR
jgi:hypothetical protein